MKTLEYLNTLNLNFEDLQKHFLDKFGIIVKQDSKNKNLFLFKYHQLESKWKYKETHECRGLILEKNNNKWIVRSRPFDKFFNIQEGNCPVFKSENIPESYSLAEKADGSLIQVWFDYYENRFRASTSGTITPFNVSEETFTFEDLFWDTVKLSKNEINNTFKKGYTFLFELCTKYNQIVTKYDEDHVKLLAVRDINSGDYEDIATLQEFRKPYQYPLEGSNVKCHSSIIEFVESNKNNNQLGINPEGFVLLNDKNIPIAKIKTSKYTQLHKIGGGDIAASKNNIIDIVFNNNLDDIYHEIPERLVPFTDSLVENINNLLKANWLEIEKIKPKTFSSRKEFALLLNSSNLDKRFFSFCFQNYGRLNKVEYEDLKNWLFSKYKSNCWSWK